MIDWMKRTLNIARTYTFEFTEGGKVVAITKAHVVRTVKTLDGRGTANLFHAEVKLASLHSSVHRIDGYVLHIDEFGMAVRQRLTTRDGIPYGIDIDTARAKSPPNGKITIELPLEIR